MSRSLCILGRQPALGLAELESLYGADTVRAAGASAALLDIPAKEVAFSRLGGSIKLGSHLTSLPTTEWPAIEAYLRKNITTISANPDDDQATGKLKIGISVYGLTVSAAKINAVGLTLKKALRSTGRSVRVVPNKELELNSAQVLHNNLASANGCEILVVRDGQQTHLARTTAVQDIDAYAARDQGRPKRDARVGMLPPKLAQIIVNLATGSTDPLQGDVVLDPFCGTGVVLQEATLMGFEVYGSDLESRMVEYTTKNLLWLQADYGSPVSRPAESADDPNWRYFSAETGDATSHRWQPMPHIVAAETYLGQPFSTLPSPEKLEQVRSACNAIHRKFLQNIGSQLPTGARLCLAVPAWQTKPGQFLHLSTLDHLEELGYNRMSFKHVENTDLVYARADQIVARELLVLIKK